MWIRSSFTNFARNKKQGDVYYKMDTHWNKMGSADRSQCLFEKTARATSKDSSAKGAEVKRIKIKSPDLLKMVGKWVFLRNTKTSRCWPVVQKRMRCLRRDTLLQKAFRIITCTKQALRPAIQANHACFLSQILLGKIFFSYLAENFSRSVRLWDARQYKFNEEVVEKENLMWCCWWFMKES